MARWTVLSDTLRRSASLRFEGNGISSSSHQWSIRCISTASSVALMCRRAWARSRTEGTKVKPGSITPLVHRFSRTLRDVSGVAAGRRGTTLLVVSLMVDLID